MLKSLSLTLGMSLISTPMETLVAKSEKQATKTSFYIQVSNAMVL